MSPQLHIYKHTIYIYTACEVLYVAGIISDRGAREITLDGNFFISYRKIAVEPDEVLISVHIPQTSQVYYTILHCTYYSGILYYLTLYILFRYSYHLLYVLILTYSLSTNTNTLTN